MRENYIWCTNSSNRKRQNYIWCTNSNNKKYNFYLCTHLATSRLTTYTSTCLHVNTYTHIHEHTQCTFWHSVRASILIKEPEGA